MKDIIGLRAHLALRIQEARENRAAAQIVLDEAAEDLEHLEDLAKMVDDYRGISEDGRRNSTRVYDAPSVGSKAAEIETAIVAVLGDSAMRSDEILQAFVERGQENLFAGDTPRAKLARLSVTLTRMHRREQPVLIYDRANRVFRVAKEE